MTDNLSMTAIHVWQAFVINYYKRCVLVSTVAQVKDTLGFDHNMLWLMILYVRSITWTKHPFMDKHHINVPSKLARTDSSYFMKWDQYLDRIVILESILCTPWDSKKKYIEKLSKFVVKMNWCLVIQQIVPNHNDLTTHSYNIHLLHPKKTPHFTIPIPYI